MGKWLEKFLDKESQNSTDNTDRFNAKTNMSVLSVPHRGVFDKNLENMPETRTDRTDKPKSEGHLSVLSVPPEGPFGKNSGNMSETRTDKTDRFDTEVNMSVLSGLIYAPFVEHSILDAFEERIAVAEYDGHQNPIQAQRIAYQDAFISVLNALPYKDSDEGDWFEERIKAAKDWLLGQGVEQPK